MPTAIAVVERVLAAHALGQAIDMTKTHAAWAGGQLHAIRYHLSQRDVIRDERSTSTQNWNEWTRSWGASVRFAGADLHYRGNLTTGAGRPGLDDFNGGVIEPVALTSSSSFRSFAAFGRTFGDVRATTHQISLSVPIR